MEAQLAGSANHEHRRMQEILTILEFVEKISKGSITSKEAQLSAEFILSKLVKVTRPSI